jgi:hypothetical protein
MLRVTIITARAIRVCLACWRPAAVGPGTPRQPVVVRRTGLPGDLRLERVTAAGNGVHQHAGEFGTAVDVCPSAPGKLQTSWKTQALP